MAKRPTTAKAAAAGATASAAPAAAPAPSTTTDTSSADTGASEPSGSLIKVTVRSVSASGRRRAGQAFGPEPVELNVSEATLEQLQGDPQLLVEVV